VADDQGIAVRVQLQHLAGQVNGHNACRQSRGTTIRQTTIKFSSHMSDTVLTTQATMIDTITTYALTGRSLHA